jgi:phage baseplate assembly protein gpV
MSDVVRLIQSIVRDQLRSFRTAELGVVTAVHPHESDGDKNNYGCDVRLRDSGLQLKHVPVSTARIGAVAIPNTDDLVLVQFLQGDIHSAIITGRLYNDQDRPPLAKAQECVYISPDDPKSGVRRLHLAFPNGNKLTLDDDKLVLELGQTTLTINNDGDIALNSNAKLTIETNGDASLQAGGNLEIKASGDVKLEGVNVAIKAQANASLEGTAGSTVKGATVKVVGQIEFAAA